MRTTDLGNIFTRVNEKTAFITEHVYNIYPPVPTAAQLKPELSL